MHRRAHYALGAGGLERVIYDVLSQPQRALGHAAASASALSLMTFEVASQRYALFLSQVIEVTRAVAIVALQQAPPVVEGAVNFRGSVVAVLDLRARFGLLPRALEGRK